MTMDVPVIVTRVPQDKPNLLSIYWKEVKYEFLKRLRMPRYSFAVVLFPAMFYALFGLIMNRNQSIHHVSVSAYLMATMGCYGVTGVALFGFGAGLAMERGQGWLEVKRASAMPWGADLVARLVSCLTFSLLVASLLLAMGIAFGGVRFSPAQVCLLVTTLVIGSIPFCALGLAIGYFARPNSAVSVINLVYVPLAFLSGFWMPIDVLPAALQKIAAVLPTYHFGQMALAVIGVHSGSWGVHVEVLAGFTLVCLGFARLGSQRDESKLYG